MARNLSSLQAKKKVNKVVKEWVHCGWKCCGFVLQRKIVGSEWKIAIVSKGNGTNSKVDGRGIAKLLCKWFRNLDQWRDAEK
jgi:hypothetical protein